MSWLGCAPNSRVFPFSDSEEQKDEPEPEYVVQLGGYIKSDRTAAVGAIIYKNREIIQSDYAIINVKTDVVEMQYRAFILALNLLTGVRIHVLRVEGNCYQFIENMENGLLGHTKPVMRLHRYANAMANTIGRIEYELIHADSNRRVIDICKSALEKEYKIETSFAK